MHRFENLDNALDWIDECQVYFDLLNDQHEAEGNGLDRPEGIELYEGNDANNYYMGGVNNGHGLGKCVYCESNAS